MMVQSLCPLSTYNGANRWYKKGCILNVLIDGVSTSIMSYDICTRPSEQPHNDIVTSCDDNSLQEISYDK